jgi:hypothetical protein
VGGQTSFSHCHSSIHLQTISLCLPEDLFQASHTKCLVPVLEDLLTSKINLYDTSDESVKKIMNAHKKITYILTKKLMTVLTPILSVLLRYQNCKFGSILSQNCEINEHFVTFSTLVLREVSTLDSKGKQKING